MEYPKIQTLYDRDPTTGIITRVLRQSDFDLPKFWTFTEKIDGMNIRIHYHIDEDGSPIIKYYGRTEKAQLPGDLLQTLTYLFSVDAMEATFPNLEPNTLVTLYGEGYGAGIQKSGSIYRDDKSFRLFDVRIGSWWLELNAIESIASTLKIKTAPIIRRNADQLPLTINDLSDIINLSHVADEDSGRKLVAEGIIARTEPLLLSRNGQRLMWKLKFVDFQPGRRKHEVNNPTSTTTPSNTQ